MNNHQLLADSILFGSASLLLIGFVLLLKTKEFKELFGSIKVYQEKKRKTSSFR